MSIFKIFTNKNYETDIPFNATDERISPFAVYSHNELAIKDYTKPTSIGEFQFLLTVDGFFTDIEEAIIQIISDMGAITSRQILQVLQKEFPDVTQQALKYRLQKLKRKNFIAKAHFYADDSRSCFGVYTLSYNGRKILQDADQLPKNSLFFRKTPAQRIKGILAVNQVLLDTGLQKYVIERNSLIRNTKTYLRIDGLMEINGACFIIESVRNKLRTAPEWEERFDRYIRVLKDYSSFGLADKPNILIIAESSVDANFMRKYTYRLEKHTNVYYAFDTASKTNIIDINGKKLIDLE